MKNDKTLTSQRKQPNTLVLEVVRSQRKRVSRYKLKKQTSFAESILQDLQVFEA